MNAAERDLACFALADVVLLAARILAGPRHAAGIGAVRGDELTALLRAARVEPGSTLERSLRAALEEATRTDADDWRHEHTRLFDGAVACPVNETAYVRRDKGILIGDVCGFYRAFGFEPSAASGEKADHLVCELEFTGVLLAMLATAQQAGDGERAEIARDALRGFLGDHLGEWLGLFCRRLRDVAELQVHACSATLLGGLWDVLAGHFGLPAFDALSDDVDEDAITDDGTPYECDECDMADAEREQPFVPLTGPPASGLPHAERAERSAYDDH